MNFDPIIICYCWKVLILIRFWQRWALRSFLTGKPLQLQLGNIYWNEIICLIVWLPLSNDTLPTIVFWGKKYVIWRGEKVVKLIQQLLYYIPLSFGWSYRMLSCSWRQNTNSPIYRFFNGIHIYFCFVLSWMFYWNYATFSKSWKCLKMHFTA